ncbi:hypothetical protein E1B28_006546 [Marasmius oreades]|uniref:F-box domain-containing protein n=1 Tax=Marasmius oreades TaxID=181124 RepID=A0A9P7UW76_9AGAR|nr:uncharacterized protein E1B28_006546 [Marasmius oreades]KAG7095851.1 hypothetical protein E1B28_006546 [Marasmius oreades]
MAPVHRHANVPWKDLSQHISLQCQGGLRFLERTRINSDEKRGAILRVVNAVVRSIESRLEEKGALFSRPDASREELRSAGVTVDGNLFPPEIVKHAETMRNPPRAPINRIDGWNFTFVSSAHIAVVLHAISEPDDPFTHLPALTHLAQRPRTQFLAVQLANFRLTDPPGYIRPRSVIEEYIRLTCRQYIFLSLLIALDERGDCFKNDGVRIMESFPRVTSETFGIEGYLPNLLLSSDPLNTDLSDRWFPSSGDKLHNSFWRLTHEDDTRRECVPALREQYIQRCFDVIAVWYAISREASRTRDAVKWHNSHYTFSITDLFTMVLDGFTSLGDAFRIPGDPLDDLIRQHVHVAVHDEEGLKEVAPVSLSSSSIPSLVKGFLDLPAELHFHILSYLPVQDLISLSMVCRSIHLECVTSILRDPLSVLGELSTDSFDSKIYRRFQSMLEARPHLLHHVRRYTGYYNYLQPLDPTKGSGRYNEVRLARGVDIRSPLASQLSRLCWAELDLWNLEYWRQDPEKAIHHALQVANKCWPHIQSLDMKVHQEAQPIIPISDLVSHELAGNCRFGCSCEPPNWRLRQLSITAHVYRDMFGMQHAPTPPIPLSSLLEMSAVTLTRLKLDLPATGFGDITNTPNLPNLTQLSLPSNLPPPDIEIFLSRCPNLASLELGAWDWSDTIPDTAVDLFVCSKLEDLHLRHTPYTISRLPASIRCIKAEMYRLLPLKLELYNPIQAPVSALGIKLDLDTRSRTIEGLHEFLRPLSKEFPKLSFLEMKIQGFYHGTDEQLIALGKCASAQFPVLETLVVNWREFENNPRRIDFPAADSGQQEREEQIARRMFGECETLKVVALTGVPPLVQDNPYVHPRVVWEKTVDGEGNVNAMRTGRSAIRWLMDFDETST